MSKELYDKLMIKHRKAIGDSMAAGHVDPTAPENYDQQGCMIRFTMRERTFLQFYDEYGTIDTQKLQRKTQPRRTIISTGDHISELAARIKSHGGIYHPILTRPIQIGVCEPIEHGHHRPEAWDTIYQNKPIPRFALAEEMLEEIIDEDGNETYVVADKIPYRREHARSIPNPPSENLPYNMEDVSLQLQTALGLDPTLDDRKDASEKLTLKVLSSWMDERFPNQFNAPSVRGKILAKYMRGLTSHQILPYKHKVTQEANLKKMGWDDNRDNFLDWYDENAKALQACITYRTGAEVLNRLAWNLISAYHDPSDERLDEWIKDGCDSLRFLVEVESNSTKFKPQVTHLKKEQKAILDEVHKTNSILTKCNVPFQIKEILLPKQLTHKKDVTRVVDVAKDKAKRDKAAAAKLAATIKKTKDERAQARAAQGHLNGLDQNHIH